MKFVHIADVHLGAVPDSDFSWSEAREKEIWNSFHNIINVCNEEKADLLLIAGDLFHRQPLVRELKEVNYYFSKLTTAQVVIMAGNHDYIGSRSAYPDFLWNERVHMFYNDSLKTVEFPEINTLVYGFSYYKRDITEPLYDNARPIDKNHINILLAHGGDEKDIPINRKRLKEAGFDYIALGHIHKPEIIHNNIAYAGSLEPLDKNETGERGYILGEIVQEQGNILQGQGEIVKEQGVISLAGQKEYITSIRFIPSSMRQYIRLTITATPETTNGSLLDMTRELMKSNGLQNIYQLNIQGVRDEMLRMDKDALKGLGNVLEVLDQTVPDYDFDILYRENADNLIGMFIKRIKESPKQDEATQKALYYGIEALLGARN